MAEQVSSLKTGIKYKNTPIGKIPVDWEVAKLKRIATGFYNGGTPDTTNRDYWNGTIPWITGADFENQKVKTIRRHITTEGVRNSATNVVPKGNLLIVTRTGVGKVAIAPFDIAISQDITGVILDSQKASPEFIYWYIDFISTKLKSTIQGTSINGLLRDDLEEIGLPLPFIEEQKRIAEILTTVDEAIEKTAQIIEKTKEVKKGLMQKLLTRGIGHKKIKRTEIGEIPGEWKIEKIANLAKENKGSIKIGPFGSQLKKAEMVDSGIRVYGQENVYRKNFNTGEYFITSEKFQKLKTVEIFPGDVLITMMGTIGDCCVVPNDIEKGIMDSHLMRIQAEKTINPYYLARLIRESLVVRKQIVEMSQGGIMGGLNLSIVKEIKIPVPSLEEQTQIENIMTRVDIKIENEQTYKSELEQIKKGLMQVLLTGKIRVASVTH